MAAVLLCGSTLAAPLLIPGSTTSASTEVATERIDDDRRPSPVRASRSAATHRLIASEVFETTTTTTTAPPRRASRPVVKPAVRKATTTTAKPRTTATTAKAKPAAAAPKPSSSPSAGAPSGNTQSGKASWYDAPPGTCAHRSLPKGLVVTVTNVGNGKQTTCRVADRGPYIDGRIIDLSRSGFEALAPLSAGVISVRIDW